MTLTPNDLLKIAVDVATEAADLARTARESAIQDVDTKSTATDVVTAADRAAERLIRERIAELRPEDAVLGEEDGGAVGEGVTWVVDPIDGTVNYLYGYPWYCVSVAARVDGHSVAGAIVEPVSGRVWTAAKGAGAWLDGRPLRVSTPESVELSLVSTGFAYSRQRRTDQAAVAARLLARVRDIRRGGSSAMDLCAVAAGWVDAYYERGLSPWDWAAGALIAAEAGAMVSLPGDDPELGHDAVYAAAPTIANPLRATLIDIGAGGDY
ncbi:inositol monophosphatase family protein [Actinokineospora xionganensis]|uniref:Inositol-1-monophosphatase n=1 Tax=Actinokineospora xionganensis TaxID=2684470 RepID=A0ABR7LAW7_9PSEU|nr:inositol monophosphatase family protein [Actinokineospora xionganensis]MBC6449437.1 inositol monophosphatase [Actinokineospora xionganensis]